MDKEFGYDSDQIDEETEARFFEKAYYGTSSLGNSISNVDKSDNFSQEPINISTEQDDNSSSGSTKAMYLLSHLKNGSSTESSSDRNLSQSIISISNGQPWLGNIFKDKKRYQTNMEALFLLLTGNYPHCVLERARKREEEFKRNHLSSRRSNSYYSAATDDDDDEDCYEPPQKSSKMDLILGISSEKLDRNVGMPEWFENLPSDPKYWAVDPEDIYPEENYYGYRHFNGSCDNCGLKGHVERDCPRDGPFCLICAREGHFKEDCSYRICPVCLKRGHDRNCRNKQQVNNTVCFRCKQKGHMTDRCPEIWRQYRFTTKAGPPVKFEQPEPQVKSCFNCGKTGHLGHECGRPSAYGQTLLYQGVTHFDKKDFFAKVLTTSEQEYEVVEKLSPVGGSPAVREREFDEPLYVSFTAGPLNSLPEPDKLFLLDSSEDDQPEVRNGNKNRNDRRHSLQHDSKHTPIRNNRRKTLGGGSRDHFSSIDHLDSSSALNGFLSENLSRRKRRTNKFVNDDDDHRNSQPRLFISNGFRPKSNNRDNSSGRDYIGFRGKFPHNSSFNGPRNNHTHRGKGSSGSPSSGNGGNRQHFRGKSPRTSRMQPSQFNRSPQWNRGNSSKSPNSRYQSQLSPLQRILKHRDKIIKTSKRRNSERKSLPNIANSPYLKLINKGAWNNRSSPQNKRQKIVWKNR